MRRLILLTITVVIVVVVSGCGSTGAASQSSTVSIFCALASWPLHLTGSSGRSTAALSRRGSDRGETSSLLPIQPIFHVIVSSHDGC
jgi:hypothetical protein